jgi:hypothetical protein
MCPKSDHKIPKDGRRTLGRRSLLATFGFGAGIAAIVAAGLGGPAHAAAGDNPPPGLLAKIQIATAATNNRTTILSRAQRKPFLNGGRFRTLP